MRRRRDAAAWLVIGVFLLNAFAPFGLAAQLPGNTAAGGFDNSAIVLCTPNGIKVIRFDDAGRPLPEDASDDGFCVLCLPLQVAQAGAPAIGEAFPQPAIPAGLQPAPIDCGLFRPDVASGAASPRAPPASA